MDYRTRTRDFRCPVCGEIVKKDQCIVCKNTSGSKKGASSVAHYNYKQKQIRNGEREPFRPTLTIEQAIDAAGLP